MWSRDRISNKLPRQKIGPATLAIRLARVRIARPKRSTMSGVSGAKISRGESLPAQTIANRNGSRTLKPNDLKDLAADQGNSCLESQQNAWLKSVRELANPAGCAHSARTWRRRHRFVDA
jgi:hypothetical protein